MSHTAVPGPVPGKPRPERGSRTPRRLAASGATLALGLTWLVVPATAAHADCLRKPVLAASSAELLRVSTLDVRTLGVDLPPLSDDRLATGTSAVASNAVVKARAGADAYQGDLPLDRLGLPVEPGRSVVQNAPPHNDQPASASTVDKDLGLVHAGAGELRALARWPGSLGCGEGTGTMTSTYTSIGEIEVLPGADGSSLLGLPTGVGETGTELARTGAGTDGVAAHASTGVQDVYVMRGTPVQSRIRVVTPPSLRVVTDGTKIHGTVEYTHPVLEVNKPGGGVVRLDSPDKTVEYGIPSVALLDGGGPLGANPLSGILAPLLAKLKLPGLASGPDLSGLPVPKLPSVLDPSLPTPSLEGTGLPDLGLDDLGLPGLGIPGPLAPESGEAPEAADLKDALTVRISVGDATSTVYKRAVVAEAASARVQVFARIPGHEERVPLLDAGLGLLSAAVAVPDVAVYTESASEQNPEGAGTAGDTAPPPAQEDVADTSGTGGALALTGLGGWLLTLLGLGTLVVVAGRVLQLVAKRRGT